MIQRRQGHLRESLERTKTVMQLDPLRAQFASEAGITAFIMRRYDEARMLLDRSISLSPDQTNAYVWSSMLDLFVNGSPSDARRRLESLSERAHDETFWEWYEIILAERDLKQLLHHISRLPSDVYEDQNWYSPKHLLCAEAHALLGKHEDSEPEYLKAFDILNPEVVANPDDPRKRIAMAFACAGLGRREEAFIHAKAGVDSFPPSKDAIGGPFFLALQAMVHGRLGDYAKALAILEVLLSTPAWVSTGHLRVHPGWDCMRHLPEFERLLTLPPKVF